MTRWSLLPLAAFCAASAFGQAPPTAMDIANLQEDIRGLTQRLNELSSRVEQLEHQASAAQTQTQSAAAGPEYATLVQLNAAVAELNHTIDVATAATRSDTLDTLNAEMQKLTREVNAALGRNRAATVAPASVPAEGMPKTGISYTVQKGDTVALLAKKTGAKAADIITFNKLADPSLIRVGQSLFIPGGQ
jgi:LysM repeat protein